MRRLITFFLSFSILLSACAPSLHDRLGKGFYSDTYTEKQVQAAANVGRVKNLGRFSKDSFACFNYSPEMTDENVMAPAIQKKLKELRGNAADNVVANRPWYFVALFIRPFLPLGSTAWTISSEALLVEEAS